MMFVCISLYHPPVCHLSRCWQMCTRTCVLFRVGAHLPNIEKHYVMNAYRVVVMYNSRTHANTCLCRGNQFFSDKQSKLLCFSKFGGSTPSVDEMKSD